MTLDVAIVGGGMAGGFLARQLVRSHPGISVALYERSDERAFKVGESTVEIGSHYMIKRLGLSRYLYENHLPKNGLRYFFDDPERSTELTGMSEIGTVNLPFYPAFQLDRSRLDGDILEMNAQSGVQVRIGARVSNLELGRGGALHHFNVEDGGRSERVAARWFIDAGGRSSMIARQEDLRIPEPEHYVESVWGRFEGVADVDDLGDESWSARVLHTARGISTMHFCYPGYWIWFIPLRGGLTSIGFVGHPPEWAKGMRTEDGFRAFLEKHHAIKVLLANAKTVDVMAFRRLAYKTKRFFSPDDHYGMVGDAAAFADPFYSPGADFIALENDFLNDAIGRDLGGESHEELSKRVQLYDDFMQFRYEAAMRLYRGLYSLFGSYELMRLKWDFDIGCYFNIWVGPYMQNEYLDERFLKRQVRQQRFVLQALDNFAELFRRAEAHQRAEGSYYRSNTGLFSYGLENIDFMEQVALPRDAREVLGKTSEIFNGVRERSIRLLGGADEMAEIEPMPLTGFMTPRPIA